MTAPGRMAPSAHAAELAGHSVDVQLRIYAKYVVGQDELVKRRFGEALRQETSAMSGRDRDGQ